MKHRETHLIPYSPFNIPYAHLSYDCYHFEADIDFLNVLFQDLKNT